MSETRPSPPGRFSTTTGLPQRADKRSANRRAVVSLALAAPNGRMKCTVRVGNISCAAAPPMSCKLAPSARAAGAMSLTIEPSAWINFAGQNSNIVADGAPHYPQTLVVGRVMDCLKAVPAFEPGPHSRAVVNVTRAHSQFVPIPDLMQCSKEHCPSIHCVGEHDSL